MKILDDRLQVYEQSILETNQALAITQRELDALIGTRNELLLLQDVLAKETLPSYSAIPKEVDAPASRKSAEESSLEKQQGTRAPKRNIRGMVLEFLANVADDPKTIKEIYKALDAPKHIVLKALEHHLATGRVVHPYGAGALWAVAKTEAAPVESGQSHPTEITESAARADDHENGFDEFLPEEEEEDGDERGESSETTKDKIVHLLQEAGDRGVSEDEFFAGGVPSIAVMQYREKGWMVVKDNRYFLNPALSPSHGQGHAAA